MFTQSTSSTSLSISTQSSSRKCRSAWSILLALPLAFLSSNAIAADKPDPETIRIHLMDGSVISGKLSMKELAIETEFGNLKVPVEKIKSLTPGLTSRPTLAKEVTKLIDDLGSTIFSDREKAQAALSKLGLPIRAELERFKDDEDIERRNRVQTILTEFDQLAEEQERGDARPELGPSMQQRDVIETTEFTIVGKIVPQTFGISSLYGDLNVKLADIRRGQRDVGGREPQTEKIDVAGTHMIPQSSVHTKVRVERGDVVTVTAEGIITMSPWGSRASSTPDGNQQYGWYIPEQIAIGTLIGKVNGADKFEKFGSKKTFTADRAGTLELGVAMQPGQLGNNFPGKYSVKIRVQPKQP